MVEPVETHAGRERRVALYEIAAFAGMTNRCWSSLSKPHVTDFSTRSPTMLVSPGRR
ncbi:protein of unknown function [Micropruina glycogenica]|uniref:Uncharacterized protein n=1 Tax=Micropruina glycogenica TaxID=75385 RepID=A0A2N9JDG8_9ACTN|nr:protein of unknown function [Micropruina glycogenica]